MPELVLALDATSNETSAALAQDGILLAEASSSARSGRRLLALVDDCFRSTGREPRDLGSIVAVAGPGSFTGVRITLATAFGLAPGVTPRRRSLSALAGLVLQAPAASLRALAVIDALREEVFVQEFLRVKDSWAGTGPPRRISWRELAAAPDPLTILTQRPLPIRWPGEVHLVGALAGAIARHGSRAGATDDALFDAAVKPLYLRSPAVSQARPERL